MIYATNDHVLRRTWVMNESVSDRFKRMSQEVKDIKQQIVNLRVDISQHDRALKMITKLEPERRCYRQVGDVLLQTTTGEAVPAVEEQLQRMRCLLSSLEMQVNEKEQQLEQFKKDNNIRLVPVSQLASDEIAE